MLEVLSNFQTDPPHETYPEATALGVIGRSPKHLALLQELQHVALTDAEVLLLGETGVGKELYAKFTHSCSGRAGEFVPINCAAIPDSLFENELFGHAAGAYTDAGTKSEGLISLAESGTIFLDEVDQLTLAAQVKLLRFLQEREYRRLGENRLRRANVRVIAATNGDLQDLVSKRVFREDLYYRINVVTKRVSALRERRSDIVLLATVFWGRYCARYGRTLSISDCAMRFLQSLDWPGNIRQLENTIRSLICEAQESQVCETAVSARFEHDSQSEGSLIAQEIGELTKLPFQEAKQNVIEAFETQYLSRMLELTDGNLCRAARACGMDPRSFRRIASARNIPLDQFRDQARVSQQLRREKPK